MQQLSRRRAQPSRMDGWMDDHDWMESRHGMMQAQEEGRWLSKQA